MAQLKILTYPDPILLSEAQAIPRTSRCVQCLVHDMLETLYAVSGVGLAAPQVGVQKRLIAVDVGEGATVLINPETVSTEGEQIGLEGCLSLPDLVGEVARAEWVTVRGLNRWGKSVTVEGEGLLARALQHGIDHLNGVLFIARLTEPTRIWSASELSKAAQKEVSHL